MRRRSLPLAAVFLCLLAGCSPRDFLTRRLAADLIGSSPAFKTPQQFSLRIGVISNKDYLSPEYLVLQHAGWLTGTSVRCPATVVPPPCWDVALSPIGVETFRDLIPSSDVGKQSFSILTARREIVAITGISKSGNLADVDFIWKWLPLNEVGDALFAGEVRYSCTVAFKHYDDGWRIIETASPARTTQDLDNALKNSEPAQ
jgi:hypothetical protein